MSRSTGAAIKRRILFILQLWPIIATIVGGVFYEVQQVAELRFEVSALEKAVDKMDGKLDTVLSGKENKLRVEDSNYVWAATKRTFDDVKGPRN